MDRAGVERLEHARTGVAALSFHWLLKRRDVGSVFESQLQAVTYVLPFMQKASYFHYVVDDNIEHIVVSDGKPIVRM